MLKKMSAWVLFLGIVTPLSAAADDSLVKFKGGIGGNAGQSVRATLLCEVANPVLHDTGLVPLELNGDFRIDDVLNPAPPADCASPVLLIRNPGGAWFAAGILKRENDDD